MTVSNNQFSVEQQLQDFKSKDDLLGQKWKLWRRRRNVLGILLFFGFMNLYTQRIHFSVSIVAMAEAKQYVLEGNENNTHEFPELANNSKLQGHLLSSFFYGYMASQFPTGWCVSRLGGVRLFGIGIGASALFGILAAPLATVNVYILFAIRIIQGLLQGMVIPSMNEIWSHWAPPRERGTLTMCALSGVLLGTVLSMLLTGIISDTLGWAFPFYIFGAISLLWYMIWWYLAFDGPALDPRISPNEQDYIEYSLGQTKETQEISYRPWCDILSSVPFWAKICAHFAANWGLHTFLTQMPKFMNDTLSFNLSKTGFLSSLPYMTNFFTMFLAGYLSDWLELQMDRTKLRKIFLSGSFFIQAATLILMTTTSSPYIVTGCLIICVAVSAFSYTTICVNVLDLAPRFASVLSGISDPIANLSGIISPALTGYIVQNKSRDEWVNVFYIASGLFFLGGFTYALLGSGEKQPWADKMEKNKYLENKCQS